MSEPITTTSGILLYGKMILLLLIPFVEPQLAGMLGSLAYLIVRHELRMATLKLSSVLIVGFFGWMGAWATVNIFAEYEHVANVWVQISSATIGFLSYDAMLMFGKNSTSVIGFFGNILKKVIEKGVQKWNS